MAFSTGDTIVGIATPPGRGGIGIVRLAGPDARTIAGRLLDRQAPLEPRRATFARVTTAAAAAGAESPRTVDEVVATWFAAPHSYTGDDVVEISGHGSAIVLQAIVELALGAGARLAEPGEFTLRAYLNGRLDLVQAEAVADLVAAVSPAQARAALDQLEGTLSAEIGRLDGRLFDLVARLEASLDFPDEGFHFITREDVSHALTDLRSRLDALVRSGRQGRIVREGCLVAIVGPPNAGKSSLFNALAGAPRAIVTDVPGTTRDAITERVVIDDLAVTLVDTAGLRETTEVVEREGVARARQIGDAAALAVVVVDGSVPPGEAARAVLREARSPRLVAVNKRDLYGAVPVWSHEEIGGLVPDEIAHVSATSGEGLEALRRAIGHRLRGDDRPADVPAITNVRHLALVTRSQESVQRAIDAVSAGATEELVLSELGGARNALEEVTGRRVPEDVLRHIFATFCIGK